MHAPKFPRDRSRRIAASVALAMTMFVAGPAAPFDVPWVDYALNSPVANPTAMTALEIDGVGPLEVVVLGDAWPVLMSILSSNGDGTYAASTPFTIDDFGATTPRLSPVRALAAYDTIGAHIVIAGTPTGGASPYYRIYSISPAGTLTEEAEIEMTWLATATVGAARCVTDVGDLDGNGINDLAFGFPDDNRVEIVFLDSGLAVDGHQTIQQGVGGFVGHLIVDGLDTYPAIAPGDDMGWSLTRLHNYAPGSPDPIIANLAIGIPGHDGNTGMVSVVALNSDGTVYLDRGWNGASLGTSSAGKAIAVEVPAEAGSRFGESVTWIPEFNYDLGDSTSSSARGDLLVGIPGLDEAGLHPDPNTTATRSNVGAIAMLDVLVHNALYTESWLVIGDRSGGLCRELPPDAALGRNAVVVGDVFGDGTADYLVLGDAVTATHGAAELLLLDMKASRLWFWNRTSLGNDHWSPVGPILPTDRLAVLGITTTTADLGGVWEIGEARFGSCFDLDPITVRTNCRIDPPPFKINGGLIIEPGGILEVQGDLIVNATVTNRGEIALKECYGNPDLSGSGTIELTADGTLSTERGFFWRLGPAVNHGLIRNSNPSGPCYPEFYGPFTNAIDGTITLDTTSLVTFAARPIDNYGQILMRSSSGEFSYTGGAPAPPNALVNHVGATLDLQPANATGALIHFEYYPLTNHGLVKLSPADADDWFQFRAAGGLVNSGTIEMQNNAYVQSAGVTWNGGAITGSGVLDVAGGYGGSVNADWTIPPGVELRLTGGTGETLTVASGATLSIEELMSSHRSSGLFPDWATIDGAGRLRIEAGAELRVHQGGEFGVFRVHPTFFECAGRIVVHETISSGRSVEIDTNTGLLIEPGGELIFDAPFYASGTPIRKFSGSIINQGLIRVDLPPGSSMQWPENGVVYANQGSIEVLSNLTVSGTGTFVLGPASSIAIGAGATMTVPNSLSNPGSLSFKAAGVLSVNGNMTQSGPLAIELGNAQPAAGSIQATGTADFTGVFNLQTTPDFNPSAANSHVLASYGNISTNEFASENFPTSDGIEWLLSYDPSELLVNLYLFSLLSYDMASGALMDLAPASGLVRPSAVSKLPLPTASAMRLASSQTGNELYALLNPGPSASLLAIDPHTLTGSTPLSLTGTAVGSAQSIVVDRSGDIIVAFDGTTTPSLLGRISRADLEGGHAVLSSIRRLGFPPGAQLDLMAISPAGQLYALDNYGAGSTRLWSIDRSTGVAVTSADIIYLAGPLDGMAFLGDELWASSSSAGELIRIDPVDGSVDATVSLVDFAAVPQTGLGGLTWRALADVGAVVRLRTVPEGGSLLIDAPGYAAPPMVLRYDLYRALSLAELAFGTPTLIDSQPTLDFVDATTVDYTTYYYRVDVIVDDGAAKAAVLDTRLYAGPGVSRPRLMLSEFSPSGGVPKVGELVEIQNLSSITQDLTGYRLSNGTAEEALSGTVGAGGFFVHSLASVDLPDAGGSLSLLAPSNDFVFDSVAWGTEGGAPAVPSGYTISRVNGSLPEDPDATSFDISTATLGAANNVPPPALGSSLLMNEVYFLGSGGQDYVELVNPLGSTVTLDQFAISDGAGFLTTIATGVQLASGRLHVLDASGSAPFAHDLTATTLYLYQVTQSGALQRVDQLGWGASIPDFAPPTPVIPNDAVVRSPDGGAIYLGERGANWSESGGGVTMFYGPQSPGMPNSAEGGVSLVVDPMGGGDATTIGAAMAVANPGTRILIKPGNYPESVTLVSGVDLVGTTGAAGSAVIQGDGVQPALIGSGIDASTTISNLVVESASGGMELISSSLSVRNVVFRNNQTTGDGAAVSIDGGAPLFLGCVFKDNQATQNGGALQLTSGTPTFEYCLFVRNSAGAKGAVVHAVGGAAALSHCVLDDNSAAGGILHSNGGGITTAYSTLTNSSLGAALRSEAGSNVFSCGLLFNNPGSTPPSELGVSLDNVLDADPKYCQPWSLNYGYASNSPLVALGSGCGTIIGITGPPCATVVAVPELPVRAQLYPPAPNPFNPSTTLRFELARAGSISLEICDVRGRLVSRPLDGMPYLSGSHEIVWRGTDLRGQRLASGVYFALIRQDGAQIGESQSLVLLK